MKQIKLYSSSSHSFFMVNNYQYLVIMHKFCSLVKVFPAIRRKSDVKQKLCKELMSINRIYGRCLLESSRVFYTVFMEGIFIIEVKYRLCDIKCDKQ